MTYDISKLVQRAAAEGLQPSDIYKRITKLPAEERIAQSTVYRALELRRAKPSTLRAICKVMDMEMTDFVKMKDDDDSDAP